MPAVASVVGGSITSAVAEGLRAGIVEASVVNELRLLSRATKDQSVSSSMGISRTGTKGFVFLSGIVWALKYLHVMSQTSRLVQSQRNDALIDVSPQDSEAHTLTR